MNKQINPQCHEDCFIPRTLDDAFKGASYGSPIEVRGRKIGLPPRSNVVYLHNSMTARLGRLVLRLVRWVRK